MNYKSIKKSIREIELVFLSTGLLLFLSCGSNDTKNVSGRDGDVSPSQYLQVRPNGPNVVRVSSSDVIQVVYPFSVELKGGSASTALIAKLDEQKEEDLRAYNKEGETACKLLPSSLCSISTSQLAFEQGATSKEIEIKFDPVKIFARFKKNGAECVIALRLTSTTAGVRKSQSNFLLHISFDYPIVNLATTSEEVSISEVLMLISVNTTFNYKVDGEIKDNPWNFSCKLEVPSNAKELAAEYNKNYKTSYQLLPAANYDLGTGIFFKTGESEATGEFIVKRKEMKTIKCLLPVRLGECSHESVALRDEICYSKIGITYTNSVITFSNATDPTVIHTEDGFYSYATQTGKCWVPIYFSKDLVNWEFKKAAFQNATKPQIPGGGAFWASEIRHINGKYVLYLSWAKWGNGDASHTTVATSDSPLDNFVNSKELLTKEDFGSNCIDQFYYEEDSKKYMFVGSFNGIYVTELTDDGLSVKRNKNGTPTLKKRVCGKAFEGTSIYRKNDYYYLFTSINNCCNGERSRYKVAVGRPRDLLEPYLGKSSKNVINDAWESVLEGGGQKFFDSGHNFIIIRGDAGTGWVIYHNYMKKSGEVEGHLGMLDRVLWTENGWPYIKNYVPSTPNFLPVFNNQG